MLTGHQSYLAMTGNMYQKQVSKQLCDWIKDYKYCLDYIHKRFCMIIHTSGMVGDFMSHEI